MEEMSVEEIAGTLGIPAGTVKSRIHKAKKVLKERLM
jgi:DNA-directed RNA polymerase specialized sigma24 family protein